MDAFLDDLKRFDIDPVVMAGLSQSAAAIGRAGRHCDTPPHLGHQLLTALQQLDRALRELHWRQPAVVKLRRQWEAAAKEFARYGGLAINARNGLEQIGELWWSVARHVERCAKRQAKTAPLAARHLVSLALN